MYCEDNGRPNWSAARALGLSLLQEWWDLTDQEALDHLSFDVRWQHALRLPPEDAYLSRRSLVDFRSRLVRLDPEMSRLRRLFERLGQSAIADLGLSIGEQRLDSTLIISNIHTRSRHDLFSKTLRLVLREIAKLEAGCLQLLSEPLQAWFARKPNSWFGKSSDEVYRRRLTELAQWLMEVAILFADTKEIRNLEAYQLVIRVLEEHCDTAMPLDRNKDDPGDGHHVTVRKPERRNDALQSPFDPDAGYGHKGAGYHVQVTETCNNEKTEILTDYAVELPGADQDKALPAVERMSRAGVQPERLYADTGYGNGSAYIDCEQAGTDLQAPFSTGRLPEDWLGRDRFEMHSETGEVVSCPAGHAPVRHAMRRSSNQRGQKSRHAFFDRGTCERCSLRERCCARPPSGSKPGKKSGNYSIELLPELIARDRRFTELQDPSFWDSYSIRAGVEATMSELKRQHGMGALRVRRKPRVILAVALKVTACNIKRWLRAMSIGGTGAENRVLGILQCLWWQWGSILAEMAPARPDSVAVVLCASRAT